MRIGSSLQRIVYSFVTFLVSLIFLVASAHSANAQCPDDTRINAAGECVFISDTKLKKTITVQSNITINCQSHRITPILEATTIPLRRSIPEVAFFLNGVQNVKIKNCTIDRFNFAIFAINSKRDPNNATPPIQLVNNEINATFVGISFMGVDNSEIRSNDLGLRTRGGRAIYVGRDSDRNRIVDNHITVEIPSGNNTQGFRVPGPPQSQSPSPSPTPTPSPLLSNTAVSEGSAVLIAQTEGPEPSLLNAFIEGQLFQLTVTDSVEPNGLFSEGNLFEGNIINFKPESARVDGLVMAAAEATRASHNTISGGRSSIREGVQTNAKAFPGKCTNSGRFCLLGAGSEQHRDCNIPNFDTGPADTCQGASSRVVSWFSRNTIIQDNEISWPFEVGIAANGQGTIITSNTIKLSNRPAAPDDPTNSIGIRLVGKFTLTGGSHPLFLTPGIVTRNTVTGIHTALNLVQFVPGQSGLTAPKFNAHISLNDFIDYRRAVRLGVVAAPDFDLPTVLSDTVLSRGNFWKTHPADPDATPPCDPGFNLRKVVFIDDSQQSQAPPLVTDKHPFRAPVARALLVPQLCPP